MRTLAWPAYSNRAINPYNWLLSTNLQRLSCVVDEFSAVRLLRDDFAVWHIHWPEHFLNKKTPVQAYAKVYLLPAMMDWMRRKGTKIVWTVHNLYAHEQRRPRLETLFWAQFTRRLDGWISLSHSGWEAARERFPALRGIPGFVIPHGHYRGEYLDELDRANARALLGIALDAKLMLFFGAIRPYKNVPLLLRVFRDFAAASVRLCVAGHSDDRVLLDTIRREAGGDARVQLHLERIPQEQVQRFFRAADLVVLPYSEILNSGTAMLALSFDRPVLVPALGALSELRTEVGEDWVRTYDGNLTANELEAALDWALHTKRPNSPSLTEYEWPIVARQTLGAFQAIVGQTTGTAGVSACR